jgi:hypothetical protein
MWRWPRLLVYASCATIPNACLRSNSSKMGRFLDEKLKNVIELDVRKPLVISISWTSEELRLDKLVHDLTTVPAPRIGPLETLDFFGFLPDSGARMLLARLVPHQKGWTWSQMTENWTGYLLKPSWALAVHGNLRNRVSKVLVETLDRFGNFGPLLTWPPPMPCTVQPWRPDQIVFDSTFDSTISIQ